MSLNVDDSLVNVEIQIKNNDDYSKRTLFYWAKLYTSELKKGDKYSQLKKAIVINIINFNMFGEKDDKVYHHTIIPIIKETKEIFSEDMSIHFFELKKVGKSPNPNNRKELWLQFLNAEKKEEFEMLKETNVPIIKKAVSVIYDM